MTAKKVYLDTSTIVKRYIEEKSSSVSDLAYQRAETGELEICFSIWNIGELLGTFDKYKQRKAMTEAEYRKTLSNFIAETTKIGRLGFLTIIPISARQMLESWQILLRSHLYVADALQIAAAKETDADVLMSADGALVRECRREGLESYDVEKEVQKARKLLSA